MGGTTSGGGGGGFIQGGAPPCSSSSSVRGFLPPCDSETEFSALFNQLLSSPSPVDPTNHSWSGYAPNRIPPLPHPSSSSSSTFHFSDDDPFHHHHHHHHHHDAEDEDAYAPLLPHSHANNTTTCPIEKNGEASELPSKAAPPARTSSKRSRAAEFHNLSEKRRRSRINEKMKALQNLIPNSNKTDKASMLDEAIEYLKQLQLQVQMLMMRNGLSLHPMSLPGGLRPMILPQAGLSSNEGNGFQNSIAGVASPANDECLARPSFSLPKQCSISNQSVAIPSVTNGAASDNSSRFQPSIKDAHCSSMPQLLLDTSRIGKSPSPDVS